MPPRACAFTNVFSTGFEASEGYDTDFDLAGQNGWIQAGSGGNGLVEDFFPGMGQQAYVGFTPPDPEDAILFVWRPINFSPVAANMPVVKFSVLTEIADSSVTNMNWDFFQWSVFNAQAQRLFTIDFDNFSTNINYQLDGTNDFVSTGASFSNGVQYLLTVTMNFAQNRWSATLDNTVLATNLPITTTNAALTLGDIDAVWWLFDAEAPGDNFMLFDNYMITAESAAAAPAQLQTLGRTGDGQFLLRLNGTPGASYAIDAASNFTSWTALTTNIAVGGSFDYIDTAAPGIAQRFYRGRHVP